MYYSRVFVKPWPLELGKGKWSGCSLKPESFGLSDKVEKTKYMVLTSSGIGGNSDALPCGNITFNSTYLTLSTFKYLCD